MTMSRAGWLAAAGLALGLATAVPAQTGPAEMPPESFAGQQYVDSRGCLFVRAGSGGETLWVPRVSRGGEPICGQVRGAESSSAAEAQGGSTAAGPVVLSGFLVAVGSFRDPANADKAAARLADLAYPVLRGRMPGADEGLVTVLAGPFDSAAQARRALRELRGAGYPDAVLIDP